MGGKAVNANVIVFDPVTGKSTLVEKGQVPPQELADQLGEHLFTAPATADGGAQESGIPPRSGKGSGRDAWAAYAVDNDVAVTEEMTRDEIVDALAAAGVAVDDTEQ